jgi:RES domain
LWRHGHSSKGEPPASEQRVGQVTLVTPQPLLVDIEAADLLVDLDTRLLVREAIDNSPLRDGPAPVHLDAALMRLGGDVGRPITQAVSRALYELHPEVDGIAYRSRIDPSERCRAIYGHVPVEVSITDLSAENRLHRGTVQEVADLLRVPLPPVWR